MYTNFNMLILSAFSGATSAAVLSYMIYDNAILRIKQQCTNDIKELKKKYEK